MLASLAAVPLLQSQDLPTPGSRWPLVGLGMLTSAGVAPVSERPLTHYPWDPMLVFRALLSDALTGLGPDHCRDKATMCLRSQTHRTGQTGKLRPRIAMACSCKARSHGSSTRLGEQPLYHLWKVGVPFGLSHNYFWRLHYTCLLARSKSSKQTLEVCDAGGR